MYRDILSTSSQQFSLRRIVPTFTLCARSGSRNGFIRAMGRSLCLGVGMH